jgi:hypothetical protein
MNNGQARRGRNKKGRLLLTCTRRIRQEVNNDVPFFFTFAVVQY